MVPSTSAAETEVVTVPSPMLPPAGMSQWQPVPMLPVVQPPPLTAVTVRPACGVSVTTPGPASELPLLVTVMVQVTVLPALTCRYRRFLHNGENQDEAWIAADAEIRITEVRREARLVLRKLRQLQPGRQRRG